MGAGWQAEGTACAGGGTRKQGLPWELKLVLLERNRLHWSRCENDTREPRGQRGVILDPLPLHHHPLHTPTACAICKWPRTGCLGPGGDQPSSGEGAGATAACPPHCSCPPQTTYKGKSSFQTYSDYLRWESFLQQQLQTFPEGSALRRGFQTCEHWKQIFMEIIGERQPGVPEGWMMAVGTGR